MTKTAQLTKMALLVALVSVMAQISIPNPMGVGMISAVTIALCLIGLLLPPKQAFLTLIVYILLGAVGLPVFTGMAGGMGKILGPTGGFILAWPFAYTALSCMRGAKKDFRRYSMMAIAFTIPITYLGAVPYYMYVTNMPFTLEGLQSALVVLFYPFILGDILKAIFASWIATKIPA